MKSRNDSNFKILKYAFLFVSSIFVYGCHQPVTKDNVTDERKGQPHMETRYCFDVSKVPKSWEVNHFDKQQIDFQIRYEKAFPKLAKKISPPHPKAKENIWLGVLASILPYPPPIDFAVGPPKVQDSNIQAGDYQPIKAPWTNSDARYGFEAFRIGYEANYLSRTRMEQCRDSAAFSNIRGKLPNDFAMCSITRPEKNTYIAFRVSVNLIKDLPEVFAFVDDTVNSIQELCRGE